MNRNHFECNFECCRDLQPLLPDWAIAENMVMVEPEGTLWGACVSFFHSAKAFIRSNL